MQTFIFLSVLVSLSFAQERYNCYCGHFSSSQINANYPGNLEPVPLKATSRDFDPYACTWPEGGLNPCKEYCQIWSDGLLEGGFNYCTRTPDDTERCYGGLFCEILYNEGFTGQINDDAVKLYYKMPDCPDAHSEWVDASRELPQALCCDQGYYDSCYGIDCGCYKGEGSKFCECGIFIPEQFDAEDSTTALPLAYVGNMTDENLFFCAQFGGSNDPCRQECELSGAEYFAQYRLSDIVPGLGITYGQAYCNAFVARYVFYRELITFLTAYQRGPECPDIAWYRTPVQHQEQLCCDNEGQWVYPCLE